MYKKIACGGPRYYKLESDREIPCRKCGEPLDEKATMKFNTLCGDYTNVLPCCNSVNCAKGPQAGWKTSGKSKRLIHTRKRKSVALNINLKDFKPRPLGNSVESLQEWLNDSKPAWDQLRVLLHMKRQVKKQKTQETMRD